MLTNINFDGEKIAGVAIIFTGYGNLEVLGVVKRIPAGQHVKPREQQRDEDEKEQQARSHDAAADFGQVIFNNGKGIQHCLLPFLAG